MELSSKLLRLCENEPERMRLQDPELMRFYDTQDMGGIISLLVERQNAEYDRKNEYAAWYFSQEGIKQRQAQRELSEKVIAALKSGEN